MQQIFPHQRKLFFAVEKVTGARTQQYMHWQTASLYGSFDKSVTRRQPILAKRRAQFDPVGPAFTCYKTGLQRLSTELERCTSHHESVSEGGITETSAPNPGLGSGPIVKTSFPPCATSE